MASLNQRSTKSADNFLIKLCGCVFQWNFMVRFKQGETRYLNTMTDFTSKHDIFTYLIHLGYLVYDKNEKTCRIPNGEIKQEWENAVEDCDEYKTTTRL